MIQITHLTPGRFGEPVLEVRMARGVSSYPAAFKGLLVGFAGLCLAISGGFALAGAVPVLGFAGLELILLFVLMRIAFRRAATEEGLRLAGDATVVLRGETETARLESYWLRIEPMPNGAQGIMLRSRDRKIAIGVGLPANELRDLIHALNSALHRVKSMPLAGAKV